MMRKWVERFRRLPTWMLYCHVSAKAVFSFGLGILLASYLRPLGWPLLVLGFVLALPGGCRILLGSDRGQGETP